MWLVSYLTSTKGNPTKKFKLDTKKYPSASVITDASPEGLGPVLLVNNKLIRALKSPVLLTDAEQLKFPLCDSASQGTVEALVVLVAINIGPGSWQLAASPYMSIQTAWWPWH